MGSSESATRLVGALNPVACCHDLSRYCLDECTCDSGCGETCCHLHLETHHTEDYQDSDEESTDQNADVINAKAT